MLLFALNLYPHCNNLVCKEQVLLSAVFLLGDNFFCLVLVTYKWCIKYGCWDTYPIAWIRYSKETIINAFELQQSVSIIASFMCDQWPKIIR